MTLRFAPLVGSLLVALAVVLNGTPAVDAAEGDGAAPSTPVAATAPAATPPAPAPATPSAKAPATPAPATPAAVAAPAVPEPGHSSHGESYNEGPRQKPYLMGNTGRVHFPITTKDPAAQQFFDQGLGQIHGFWYFEAERSFRQVAALDPNCAMAYWGMAMANANNDKRAKSFVDEAMKKKATASPREIAWIEALSAALTGADNGERRRKYVRDLEALVQDYPNDIEAKAFLALQIWKNGSWMTNRIAQVPISSHQAVDALLDQVFAVEPMHPVHHYRVHLWDDVKPARALVSASLCGQSAPGVAHMWHMSGHTYSKFHRYVDAVWQQEAAARVDHAHMMRDRVLPDQIHNYAHNNEWLIRNLTYLGRVHDARDLAVNMIELPRHPKYNTLTKGGTSAGYGHQRLGDELVQFECWEELLGPLNAHVFEPQKNDADEQLRKIRLTGLAQIGLNQLDAVRAQIAALDSQLTEKKAARTKASDEAEAKARAAKKSEADVAKAMAEALQPHGAALLNFERIKDELNAYLVLASGDAAQAKPLVEKLKDIPAVRKEHLARAFSLVGDHVQAEALIRKEIHPGQTYAQALLVEILHRAGKSGDAKNEFGKLRSLAAFADLDVRAFQRLKPIAAEFGLPEDWRGSRELAPDSGQRPDLNTLGPFRWAPTPAISWTLPGSDGRNVSLDDYRGKPVIVLFYLGAGCLHCVEQIQKFAPMTGDFTAAGISLVAISSEPLDTLKGSLAKLAPNQAIPFPLAADPELNVFKSYRAFDDFENQPLHGLYLIDGDGLVRWHDIGFEPFSDAKFLLEEAKRQLKK